MAEVSKVLRDNLVKAKKVVREGIRSYILDLTANAVTLDCLTLSSIFVDGVVTFMERFYHKMKGTRWTRRRGGGCLGFNNGCLFAGFAGRLGRMKIVEWVGSG